MQIEAFEMCLGVPSRAEFQDIKAIDPESIREDSCDSWTHPLLPGVRSCPIGGENLSETSFAHEPA
jgi:hypothetical protein